MADLALVTDHTAEALALLIDQYRELPRLSGLISSYTNRLQEFEQAVWDVTNKRLLDYTDANGNPAHAVGEQLDAIGRIVGQGRNGQSDATFLLYVRARIFVNRSTGRRDQIIALLLLVEPALFTFTEYFPATVLIEYQTAPSADPRVLVALAKQCVAGGVKLYLTAPPPSVAITNTFAFSNYGSTSNSARSFGHFGSSSYGGVMSSEYV